MVCTQLPNPLRARVQPACVSEHARRGNDRATQSSIAESMCMHEVTEGREMKNHECMHATRAPRNGAIEAAEAKPKTLSGSLGQASQRSESLPLGAAEIQQVVCGSLLHRCGYVVVDG